MVLQGRLWAKNDSDDEGSRMTSLLYGIHDKQGAHIIPPGGWCLDVVALSENPQPTDYAALRGDINWIVRLQWGFGTTGNIPLPHEFDKMRTAAAAYAHNSRGANIFIVGNEPNHEQERPNGVFITPAQYAHCFAMCRDAIKQARPGAQVLPAPCAPYHANPISWLEYWREMLFLIASNGGCDGLAVHAYTRSSNAADITGTAMMGPPLQDTYSGFLTYVDALDAIPSSMRLLPAYITEFNELLPDGWDDRNTGVVQAAYADINNWNGDDADNEGTLIHALILYRWPKFDKWHIEGKQGVIDDFRAAVGHGYQSPPIGRQEQVDTHIPAVSSGTSPVAPATFTTFSAGLPPREWDSRLDARGVTIETPPLAPGQQYWRVAKARWWNEQESQGRHHIYIEAPNRTAWRVVWPSGSHPGYANGKSGFDASNYPMSKSLNEFSVQIRGDMDIPSETLKGIGMGDKGNSGIHTSTGVTFELATMPATQPTPPQPAPATLYVSAPAGLNLREKSVTGKVLVKIPFGSQVNVIAPDSDNPTWFKVRYQDTDGYVYSHYLGRDKPTPAPTPEQPQPFGPAQGDPVASGDKWQRSIAFVLKQEGGLSTDRNDPGNYVNGVFVGTNFGISAAAHPGVDIVNLTVEQAKKIYEQSYWIPSGASTMPFPMCLAVMDLAVNGGVGRAKEALAATGDNFVKFMAWRLAWYTRLPQFNLYGAAWIRRCSELMMEAAK